MVGYYNEEPAINPEEVEAWKWMAIDAVKEDMANHPEHYTAWFRIIFDKFYKHIEVL